MLTHCQNKGRDTKLSGLLSTMLHGMVFPLWCSHTAHTNRHMQTHLALFSDGEQNWVKCLFALSLARTQQTHTHARTRTRTLARTYTHVHAHTHIYTHKHAHTRVHTHRHIHITIEREKRGKSCVCWYMCVCMYTCLYLHMHSYVHTHTQQYRAWRGMHHESDFHLTNVHVYTYM